MTDLIVVEDRVDGQCVRHLHLMSNIEFDQACMTRYSAVNGVVTREAGVWHLRAMHPYRGVVDIPAACVDGKVRRLVAWNLDGCASVRVALQEAAREFEKLFGGRAQFGFMKKLPEPAEHGMEIGDLILLEADWMLEKCVAVGCKT